MILATASMGRNRIIPATPQSKPPMSRMSTSWMPACAPKVTRRQTDIAVRMPDVADSLNAVAALRAAGFKTSDQD